MSNSDYAAQKLSLVNARIREACKNIDKNSQSVTLIGASKKQTPELINKFLKAGLSHIGENYLQEALEKQNKLNEIQSNKTKAIAQHFNWVHGVDRLKIAKRLAQQHGRPDPINLLIQLNPDDENSKAGVSMAVASDLAAQIAELEYASLRGFMMIPKKNLD